MRNRHALIGALVSLILTGILTARVVAIDNAGAVVILMPALLGSLIALKARNRIGLVLAAVLTAMTAIVTLIGWIGVLYFPSVALFVSAAIGDRRIPADRTAPPPV